MNTIRTKGAELFERRLRFADKYMVYNRRFPDEEKRIHAIADAHTHLMDFYFVSPRIGFWSPQGACGKSNCLKISYFHVYSPLYEEKSGAGIVHKINQIREEDGYPTLLLDEAHRIFTGEDNAVASYVWQYSKGTTKTLWIDGKAITLDVFGPVFVAGLTNKNPIDPNFLERNVQLPLERPLQEEQAKVELLPFALAREELEDENGNCPLRDEWTWWANDILDDNTEMKATQAKMIELIRPRVDGGRKLELALPLVQTAYYIGDGLHEQVLDDLCCLWGNEDTKHTINEKLLIDVHEIVSDRRNIEGNEFVATSRLLTELYRMDERPWRNYKGRELSAETLAWLLEPFGIKPIRDRGQTKRGYYVAEFIEPWKRAVKLEMPLWMNECYGKGDSEVDRVDKTDAVPCEPTSHAGEPASTYGESANTLG